jgi:hypothetical protein
LEVSIEHTKTVLTESLVATWQAALSDSSPGTALPADSSNRAVYVCSATQRQCILQRGVLLTVQVERAKVERLGGQYRDSV